MAEQAIEVEVAYASAAEQRVLSIMVPLGATARMAIERSGMAGVFPHDDLAHCTIGIYGKPIADPDTHVLEEGDRVELYRPLLADPMEVQRQRAARAKAARQAR